MAVSADVYRFLSGLSVDGEGTVIENQLDKTVTYVSQHYTPSLTVSKLSVAAKASITLDTTDVYNNSTSQSALLYKLQHTALAVTAPDIYRQCQAVLLDVYSIVYAYEDDTNLLVKLSNADIDTTINNALYLQDYFSGLPDYASIAEDFAGIVIALGVVKNFVVSLYSSDKETVSAYGTV